METYPPSPLTVGSWVCVHVMGHSSICGQVLELQPAILIGVPAYPETAAFHASPARSLPYGWSALHHADPSTEAEVLADVQRRRPAKPEEWTPEYFSDRWGHSPEVTALAMELHERFPDADHYRIGRLAYSVSQEIEGDESKKEAAIKMIVADDDVPF